jgi:hypothetical protein
MAETPAFLLDDVIAKLDAFGADIHAARSFNESVNLFFRPAAETAGLFVFWGFCYLCHNFNFRYINKSAG